MPNLENFTNLAKFCRFCKIGTPILPTVYKKQNELNERILFTNILKQFIYENHLVPITAIFPGMTARIASRALLFTFATIHAALFARTFDAPLSDSTSANIIVFPYHIIF